MGVIIRQSIKFSVVSFFFNAVSVLAVLFLYSRDKELYGTMMFYLDTAMLLAPLVLLGMGAVCIRFYPSYSDHHQNRRALLNAGFVVLFFGVILLLIMWLIFGEWSIQQLEGKSKSVDFRQWFWVLILLAFLRAVSSFFFNFISNYHRVAITNAIGQGIRIWIPLVFILVILDKITAVESILLLVLYFVISLLLYFYYLWRLDKQILGWTNKAFHILKKKNVRSFALFSLLSALGSSLAFKLDTTMVTGIMDTTATGIYKIANNIGNFITIPLSGIFAITAPIISKAIHNNELTEVKRIYQRSSGILIVIGTYFLAGLAACVPDLFGIIPDGSEMVIAGAYAVVFLIALAKFMDMATSVNSYIITYSKYYKYSLYFLLILAAGNTVLNLILIPKYGIIGAALASFIALVVFNLLKTGFIKMKFGFWPFRWENLKVMAIGIISAILALAITYPFEMTDLTGLIARGFLVSLIFLLILFFSKSSEDFNALLINGWKQVRILFSKKENS